MNSMLARLPFAISEKLGAGAVNEQVQGVVGAPIGDLDSKGLLPSAHCGVVGQGPVQARHLHQTGYHRGRLPEGQLERRAPRRLHDIPIHRVPPRIVLITRDIKRRRGRSHHQRPSKVAAPGAETTTNTLCDNFF